MKKARGIPLPKLPQKHDVSIEQSPNLDATYDAPERPPGGLQITHNLDQGTRIYTPSKEELAGKQFDPHPYHMLALYNDKEMISTMSWHPETGEIHSIQVHPNYRGLGVATHTYERAKKFAEEKGLAEPIHSSSRTVAGDAWAKSIGDPVPVKSGVCRDCSTLRGSSGECKCLPTGLSPAYEATWLPAGKKLPLHYPRPKPKE